MQLASRAFSGGMAPAYSGVSTRTESPGSSTAKKVCKSAAMSPRPLPYTHDDEMTNLVHQILCPASKTDSPVSPGPLVQLLLHVRQQVPKLGQARCGPILQSLIKVLALNHDFVA